MEERRCPLCNGMLLENICIDCGFESLEESDISAPYDFDPNNDRFGEAEVYEEAEYMDGISAAEIALMPEPEPPKKIHQPNNTPVQNNAQNVNVQNNFNNIPPVQQNVPLSEIIISDIVGFIKKYWWQLLLMLLTPSSGIFIGIAYLVIARVSTDRSVILKCILKGFAFLAAGVALRAWGIGFLEDDVIWTILRYL